MTKRKVIAEQPPQEGSLKTPHMVLFGFQHLHDASFTKCKDITFFIHFLKRMKELCSLEWGQIDTFPRHGMGYERIKVAQIKKDIAIPYDNSYLLAFRATGDNHSFLGYRDGDVFQVLFIEASFGDIYKHS